MLQFPEHASQMYSHACASSTQNITKDRNMHTDITTIVHHKCNHHDENGTAKHDTNDKKTTAWCINTQTIWFIGTQNWPTKRSPSKTQWHSDTIDVRECNATKTSRAMQTNHQRSTNHCKMLQNTKSHSPKQHANEHETLRIATTDLLFCHPAPEAHALRATNHVTSSSMEDDTRPKNTRPVEHPTSMGAHVLFAFAPPGWRHGGQDQDAEKWKCHRRSQKSTEHLHVHPPLDMHAGIGLPHGFVSSHTVNNRPCTFSNTLFRPQLSILQSFLIYLIMLHSPAHFQQKTIN